MTPQTPNELAAAIRESQDACRYLNQMYEYYFRPVKTGEVTSLNITLHDLPNNEGSRILNGMGNLNLAIDWRSIVPLSLKEKHSRLLEVIQQAILNFIGQNGWDVTPFQDAYDKIIENQFLFRENAGRPVSSHDKRTKAQVCFHYDYLSDGTFVNFSDKKGKLIRRVRFAPNGLSFLCGAVGAIRWVDDTHVAIYHVYTPRAGKDAATNTKDYWLIGADGTVDFIKPNAAKDPHAMYQLGLIFFNGRQIMPDKDKGLALISKSAGLGYKHAKHWLAQNAI